MRTASAPVGDVHVVDHACGEGGHTQGAGGGREDQVARIQIRARDAQELLRGLGAPDHDVLRFGLHRGEEAGVRGQGRGLEPLSEIDPLEQAAPGGDQVVELGNTR